MKLTELVVEGTIKPDGTLELDQKPNLAPGRVTVVLRQAAQPAPPLEGWWPYMQRARRELEAVGSHFMDEKEMNDHIQWLREEDRIDIMLRQGDEDGRQKEQS